MELGDLFRLMSDSKNRIPNIMDLKKLIISYMLLDPTSMLNIKSFCHMINDDNDNDDEIDMKIVNDANNYVCNNLMLYQFLWLKYVSKTLPKSKGIEYIKEEFYKAINLYNVFNIETIGNIDQYEIIKKNIKNTKKLFTNHDEIQSILEKMNYYDLKIKGRTFLLHFLNNYTEYRKVVGMKYIEIVLYMLKGGASVDLHDDNDNTVLIYACKFQNPNLVQLFINYNAKINEPGRFKETPLMVACQNSSTEIIKLLLDNGADLNLQDRYKKTSLMYACQTSLDNVKLLYEQKLPFFVNQRGDFGRTALNYAVGSRKYEIVDYLINNPHIKEGYVEKADVNLSTESGYTVLMDACGKGNYEIAKLLIDNGADVNAQDKNGQTALWSAFSFYVYDQDLKLKIIKLLIDSGININLKDKNGNNILSFLSYNVSVKELTPDILKLFIDAGIDIDNMKKNMYLLDLLKQINYHN